MADINDMVIYSYGCSSAGNQKVVMSIGSQAEGSKRLAAFIDWLYSPEGIPQQQGHRHPAVWPARKACAGNMVRMALF